MSCGAADRSAPERNRNHEQETRFMRNAFLAAMLGSALLLSGGCEKKGPFEEAGEKVDNAMEQMKDSGEEASDAMKDAMKDVEKGAEEAAQDVKDAAKDAADELKHD